MLRAARLVSVTALLLSCTRVEPAANVISVAGQATFKKGGEGNPIDALAGSGLYEGDIISTGADSKARIEFRGGNVIDLNENSSLLVKASGGTAAEFGALLLSGTFRAESGRQNVLLTIGTPSGQAAQLGGGELVVEVDLQRGLTVVVGQVTVELPDGSTRVAQAGSVVQIDGLVVPVGGPAPVQEVALDPLTVAMLANTKHVQVQRAGTSEWITPKKRDVLAPGDSVRTRKATGTQLQFGDASELLLSPGAELVLQAGQGNAKQRRAKYTLSAGSASLRLTRNDALDESHELLVAGVVVSVKPGDASADVAAQLDAKGRAELEVRFGRVVLSDGTEVTAGTRVTLEAGKTVGEPAPLANTDLELRLGATAVVNYHDDIPPLLFTWRGEQSFGEYQVELANDKDFQRPVFKETVKRASFVYDQGRAGRFWWRVKAGGSQLAKGSFTLQRGGDNDCPKCQRNNTVKDTGEKTVIYFQQALPAITLEWKPAPGAAQYRVKVFKDGEFEKALSDKTVAETRMALSSGTFAEGKYFWLVQSLDANGKTVASGGTNGLEIAYDNAITDLVLRSPKQGQKITTSKLAVAGEVALGAKLFINGRPTGVDDKGRFRDTMNLNRGTNVLVLRTVDSAGVDRFYVRTVTRR